MVDHKLVKLGKKPAKIDSRTLRLAKYFLDTLAPSLPAVDYTKGETEFGMMLNDQLGDCTIAGLGHGEQIVTVNTGDAMLTLPDDAILQKYEQWCGYVNGDPSTDQGGVEIDVLNAFRKSGFWKHVLTAYADPDPTNLEHVKKAIELFGGIYIGVSLPVSAQGERTWDVGTGDNGIPGSWGGHAVWVPKYETLADGTILFTCISWGELYQITQAFWTYNDPTNGPYVDETHALLLEDWLRWKGMPEGFDFAQLQSDLLAVAA